LEKEFKVISVMLSFSTSFVKFFSNYEGLSITKYELNTAIASVVLSIV